MNNHPNNDESRLSSETLNNEQAVSEETVVVTDPVSAEETESTEAAGAQAPAAPQKKKKKAKEVVVQKRTLTGVPYIIVTIVCVAGVLYHLWVGALATQSALQMRSMHWAIMAFVAFLIYPMTKRTKDRVPFYDWILAVIAAGVALYLFFNFS